MSDQVAPMLETRTAMEKLDQSHLLSGIETLADQVLDAWNQVQSLDVTPPKNVSQVVVAGMGGSGLGAGIAETLFRDRLTVPILQVQDYDLPNWVGPQTLVIATSFSGGTEEIVSAAQQALEQQAQVAIVTGGGTLLELAQTHQLPLYQMDPAKNPSSENRVALGYSIFGLLAFMAKLGVYELSQQDVDELVASILHKDEQCQVDKPQDQNPAKTLAYELLDRRPILVGAEHLAGALHTAANVLNENSKTFAEYRVIPEMNHHLMEGLSFPKSIKSSHLFVCFQSDLYHSQNQKRLDLTAEVAENNDLDALLVSMTQTSALTQVGEVLVLMTYTAFYLSMLEQINPGPLPNVDWFKAELKQR